MGQLNNNQQIDTGGGNRLNVVTDYLERVDNISPRAGQFSQTASSDVIPIYVTNWDKYYATVIDILGYHYTANKQLRRVLPRRHPVLTQMYATRFDNVRGVQFQGKDAHDLGLPETARYRYLAADVTYEAPNYQIRSDNAVASEAERYVSWQAEPREDVILLQSGENLTFAEGDGQGGAPTAGSTAFPQTIGVIESKTMYRITWHKVPEDFVANGLRLVKFDSMLGKVNSKDFLGFPKGTLLFRPPQVRRYAQTVRLRDPDGVSFLLDITLNLQFFDPPLGAKIPKARGHNTKPHRDRKYYLVTGTGPDGNAGDPNGVRIFQEDDFAKVFQHWDL